MKIINVVGARPNFMKIAPIMSEMVKSPEIEPMLLHTGQHYDETMSKLFFDELEIPKPDINLEVGSGSHAFQTAEIMKSFEPIILNENPDGILVVGDVNSTIACAMVAVKLGVKVIHVEAGLRSFDRSMPEEINRVLTDAISDFLFTTERSANENLKKEGIPEDKCFFVGNVMIDTLLRLYKKSNNSDIHRRLGLGEHYILITLHRPSNVDDVKTFRRIASALEQISATVPIIFPAHPRTKKNIERLGFSKIFKDIPCPIYILKNGIYLVEPLGYLDFLCLMSNAKVVLTDSGGIQEETTVLGVPCITLRNNTERPVTITEGSNILVGSESMGIIEETRKALNRKVLKKTPELWDGKASERIIKILIEKMSH